MHKILSAKTILTALIGTSIAGSLTALPVRANEDSLVNQSSHTEISLSQNAYDFRNNPNNPEPADNFTRIVGITGLLIGAGYIGLHLTHAYKPSLVNSLPKTNNLNNHNTSLLDRINPKLRRELLRLVHNQQTADRLLYSTSISHPDRSANWCAEKVIYDLKRDRV